MTASSFQLKRSLWQTIAILTLGFWLSSSLLLDWVIMPSLYISGMMTQPGFTTAGYLIFWNFNRIELLSAAAVLTSILALGKTQFSSNWHRHAVVISLILLAISLIDTYFLTPQMSTAGLQLNLIGSVVEIPSNMNQLHIGYWVLEAIKLFAGGTLLYQCFRQEG